MNYILRDKNNYLILFNVLTCGCVNLLLKDVRSLPMTRRIAVQFDLLASSIPKKTKRNSSFNTQKEKG